MRSNRMTVLAVGGAFALGALGANALADDGETWDELSAVEIAQGEDRDDSDDQRRDDRRGDDDKRRIDGARDDDVVDLEPRDEGDDGGAYYGGGGSDYGDS